MLGNALPNEDDPMGRYGVHPEVHIALIRRHNPAAHSTRSAAERRATVAGCRRRAAVRREHSRWARIRTDSLDTDTGRSRSRTRKGSSRL